MAAESQSIIHIEDIREVLDTLANSTSIPQNNSLRHLSLVDEFMARSDLPRLTDSRQYILREIFIDIIFSEFRRQYALFDIDIQNSVSVKEHSKILQGLSQIDSLKLWHWSVLYYLYVRVDLNMSISSVADMVNLVPRTIRRYRNESIYTFHDLLIHLEWESRIRIKRTRLRSCIDFNNKAVFMGRESEIQTVANVLQSHSGAKFYVTGESGIGKSAFIRFVLNMQLDEKNIQFDEIIWIDHPASVDDIRQQVFAHLCIDDNREALNIVLSYRNVVIVIDAVEQILKAQKQSFDNLLLEFQNTHMLFSSVYYEPLVNVNMHVPLNRFSYLESKTLLRKLAHLNPNRGLTSETYTKAIYDLARGNPLGTIIASQHFSAGNFETASENVLVQIYERLFSKIDFSQKLAWCCVALCDLDQLSVEELAHFVGKLIDRKTFVSLKNYHLVEATHRLERPHEVSVPSGMRRYIHEILLKSDTILLEFVGNSLNHLNLESSQRLTLAISFLNTLNKLDLVHKDNYSTFVDHVLNVANRFSEVPEDNYPRLLNLLESSDAFTAKSSVESDLFLKFIIGNIHRRLGNWNTAIKIQEHLLNLSGRLGEFETQNKMLLELVILMRRTGNYERALGILRRLSTISSIEDEMYARTQIEHARICVDRGNADGAKGLLESIHPELLTLEVIMLFAEVELLDKRFSKARSYIEKGFELAGNSRKELAQLHIILAQIFTQQINPERALQEYETALNYLNDIHDIIQMARVWMNMGSLYISLEDWASAEKFLRKALRVLHASGDRLAEQVARRNLQLISDNV